MFGRRTLTLRLAWRPSAARASLALYLAAGTLLLATVPYEHLLARPSWLVPMLWWALSIAAGAAVGRWALLVTAPLPWLVASAWYAAAEGGRGAFTADWAGALIGVTVLAVFGIATGVLLRHMRPGP